MLDIDLLSVKLHCRISTDVISEGVSTLEKNINNLVLIKFSERRLW